MGPRRRGLAMGGLLGLALTACAGGDPGPSGPATPTAEAGTITVTVGTLTATRSVTATVAPSAPGGPQPPPATPEPAPVPGECPYLTDDRVAEINGQRTGTTTVVDVAPYPICTFTRSDGEWLATVRIVAADTPEAATAAVDQHVPVDGSDPARDPAGWTGGSMPTDGGSVYAVSKGDLAVIAEANQPQSIKGRQLAVAAIANLGL